MINTPKVSIGLPVLNGEKYLAQALDSLLGQTLDDFEIIICDNASVDATEAICRGYAARDHRIRYYRNERNLGAAKNFNKTFGLSKGKYFKWSACDDLCASDFLEVCHNILEKDDSIVVCHSYVSVIDEEGNFVRHHSDSLSNHDSFSTAERFFDFMGIGHWCFDIFGLIRKSCLDRTPLIASYYGSDRNLLAELSLMGRIYRVPEYLFLSRDHKDRSVRAIRDAKRRTSWFDPKTAPKVVLPHWKHFFEYVKSLYRAQVSIKDRAACYYVLAKWLKWNWKLLKQDLKGVLQ
jgi:glycosyltransferase involved in cell wall biosynthesis